jgi:TldD protein
MWNQQIKERIRNILKRFESYFSYISIRYENATYTTIKGPDFSLKEIGTSYETGYALTVKYNNQSYHFSLHHEKDIYHCLENLINKNSIQKDNISRKNNLQKINYCDDIHRLISFRKVNHTEKIEFINQIYKLLSNYNLILQPFNYFDCSKNVVFIDTDEKSIDQVQIYKGFYAEALLEDDIDSGFAIPISLGSYDGLINLSDVEEKIKTAQQVLNKLITNGVEPPSGVFDVILSPELSATLIHEVVGHISEADTFYNNILKLGSKVSIDELNVSDVPMESKGFQYDDEGTKSTNKIIIKNGYFTGLLHSKKTSDTNLSGNGRAVSYRFPPICRMKQTYIEPGKSSLDEMFRNLNNGLYLVGYRGGNVFEGKFNIQSAYGFYVENGQLTSVFPSVSIHGYAEEVLKQINLIGNDLELIRDAGGCDKHDQYNLPNEMKSPSLLIKNLMIGDNVKYEI